MNLKKKTRKGYRLFSKASFNGNMYMYITDKFIFSDDFFMYKQIFIFFFWYLTFQRT